jgi:hypothetical protein
MTSPTDDPPSLSPAGHLEDEPSERPPVLDDDAPDPAALAGLRTVAARMDPTPFVNLAGVDLATGPGSVGGPMVLDDLAVTWGRNEVLDQPTPATATLSLFDPTGVWAVGRELIGASLNLGFITPYPGETTPRRQVFFRGRITDVALAPRSELNTRGAGAVLTIGASSLLNDLANVVPFENWPEETLGARANRVAAFTTGAASSVTVRTYWQAPNVAPVAATDQPTVLDSLTDLYASSGPDRMVYFPDDRRVYFLNRRSFVTARTMAQLWWHPPDAFTHSRENAGAYALTRAVAGAENGLPATQNWLDAAAIEYGDQVSRNITNRVTRVELPHKDAGSTPTPFSQRVELSFVPGSVELNRGIRAVRQESMIVWNNYAQTAADDLAQMMGNEGSGWSVATLTVRPDLAGGFDYYEQFAQLLLSGAEQPSPLFLQRSWFPRLGIRPIVGIIGGVIRYAGGGWQVDIDVLPISTTVAQHAIAWDEIDDGSATYTLEWHDDTHPRGLHESLTYEDIGFVGMGLGMTTIPADRGWDQVYTS